MARRQEWYTTGFDANFIIDNGGAGSTQKGAQSFTLGTTGNNLTFEVTQVKVRLKKTLAPTGNATIRIQGVDPSGLPDGTDLSTGTIDLATTTTSYAWYTITMSSATLEASQKYALIIDTTTATVTDVNYLNWEYDSGGATYAGGAKMDYNGTVFSEDAGTDTMFEIDGGTYTGTLCTLAEAVNKMGANASTGSTEEVLVSDYVRQAEGVINAVTRFDWVTAYSGLTDEVRFILNQVASDLAAIYGITYDMSGYTADTVEAETMLNIYREAVARGVSLLRNQEVKRFIVNDT